jgi:hypothetical protein
MARVFPDGRNGYALTLKDGQVYVRSRYTYDDGLYCITRELLNLRHPPEFYAACRTISAAMHIATQACAEWMPQASTADLTRTLLGTLSVPHA